MRSRTRAARSNSMSAASRFISAASRAFTARDLPRRKSCASPTSSSYPSCEISPVQGAEQRRIWCSMHGRVRLSNTLSEQDLRRNAFCSVSSVRFTAQVLANGPK